MKRHKHKSESSVNNNNNNNNGGVIVGRAISSLSVVDFFVQPARQSAHQSMTIGRSRNLDEDMEHLRASRHDNPFVKQAIIASRESLIEEDGGVDDDVNLMTKELSLDLDPSIDPLTLPEMHEHLIRSPPPTTWPKSPNFKAFQFPKLEDDETALEGATWSSTSNSETLPLMAEDC